MQPGWNLWPHGSTRTRSPAAGSSWQMGHACASSPSPTCPKPSHTRAPARPPTPAQAPAAVHPHPLTRTDTRAHAPRFRLAIVADGGHHREASRRDQRFIASRCCAQPFKVLHVTAAEHHESELALRPLRILDANRNQQRKGRGGGATALPKMNYRGKSGSEKTSRSSRHSTSSSLAISSS